MIDLMDEHYSEEARLYFRDMRAAKPDSDDEISHFKGVVNALNAIKKDNANELQLWMREANIQAKDKFIIFQFTDIPYNEFAAGKTFMHPKEEKSLLQMAREHQANKCLKVLEPEKKKHHWFHRK